MTNLIVVRGAGDLASGTIHRLKRAGFPVLALEAVRPAAIRRSVAFCEAVYESRAAVENITAVRIDCPEAWDTVSEENSVPLLVDPNGLSIAKLQPPVVVDAILAKRNMGTYRDMAPLTIALGPGFYAGTDVDYVIETMRGHNLGRIIAQGTALPNTGIPGMIGGYGAERVLHAEQSGTFYGIHRIGDFVEKGETIAEIRNDHGAFPVRAAITGLLRGILRDGFEVPKGFKLADIDPRREEYANCFTISDKSRCIAGSVLELVCRYFSNAAVKK